MGMQRKTDWLLFTAVVALVGFGLVVMYSASSVVADLKYGHSTYYLLRQLAAAVAAFLVMMYLKNRDYHDWNQPVWAFAPMGIAIMLLAVAYFADAKAHRWIRWGPFQLQPNWPSPRSSSSSPGSSACAPPPSTTAGTRSTRP
jgi:cell division protein FtsW